jgi:predicted thioesterase
MPRGGVGDVRHRHHLPTLIGTTIVIVIVIRKPKSVNEKTMITAAVIAA